MFASASADIFAQAATIFDGKISSCESHRLVFAKAVGSPPRVLSHLASRSAPAPLFQQAVSCLTVLRRKHLSEEIPPPSSLKCAGGSMPTAEHKFLICAARNCTPLKPEQRTRCGAGHTGHRRMSWSSGCSTSRFFVNLFDFCYSLVVIPAVEQQDVAMLDGGYQGIMILRPIAIRGQQNAERF